MVVHDPVIPTSAAPTDGPTLRLIEEMVRAAVAASSLSSRRVPPSEAEARIEAERVCENLCESARLASLEVRNLQHRIGRNAGRNDRIAPEQSSVDDDFGRGCYSLLYQEGKRSRSS